MGKSTEPTCTGRNGAGRLLPSCFKRRSLGPAAVAQPSDPQQCLGHSLACLLQKDFPLTSLCTSQMLTACEKHSKLTSELVNF